MTREMFALASMQAAVAWSEAEFIQQVNTAFKDYGSVLALARLPFANSPLVTPLLVLDDVSPTADERGRAVRLVLRWAVQRMAPGSVAYPLGEYRPFDDPTWRDPLWWRYNILRHRYLEPLHPDDFVDGGRYTETLIALTGIPTTDTFFDERNRAVREVAHRLREQLVSGEANDELQQLALEEAIRPLQADNPLSEMAAELLGIAAAFDEVFPRDLLLHIAQEEGLTNAEAALDFLARRRFLLVGEAAQHLWISPVLRRYIYARQPATRLAPRHRRAARYFADQDEPLAAARHLQRAGRGSEAAALLLGSLTELLDETHPDDLCAALDDFRSGQLPPAQWREVQIWLSDLHSRAGRQAEALTACRQALQAADEAADQARIYRRMGKLYEKHNPLHALGYYQQAAERFPPDHPEFLPLLKDRAWLHILRQEWERAEETLALAQQHMPLVLHGTGNGGAGRDLRADIYDALASLHRHRKQYDDAVANARRALGLREETGDLARVANSFNNLGLIYNDMGDYRHAIQAYEEAMATYRKLGNRSLIAGALLNIGMAHHLDGRLSDAVKTYRDSLALCREIGLPLVEVRAHLNLAEALADLQQGEEARRHWRVGYDLSARSGFADELADFRNLQAQYPALQTGASAGEESAQPAPETPAQRVIPMSEADPGALNPIDARILDLARRNGSTTPKLVMQEIDCSKATATRRLASLVERGLLEKRGDGRATTYVAVAESTGSSEHSPQTPDLELVRHVVRRQAEVLSGRYGVRALGVLDWTQAHPTRRYVARFARLPDLVEFFRLEALLGEWLGAEIDLTPEETLPARKAVPGPLWVWQAAEIQG